MASQQEQTLAYLKGEMNAAERATFEQALAASDELRAELARSRELLDRLAAASEESIQRLVHAQIVEAIQRGASDIHIVPERESTVVRLRIDGVLHEAVHLPHYHHAPLVNQWKTMADLSVAERRVPQEGRIPVRHEGRDFDLRVTVLPTLYGERVTARILDRSQVLVGLDKLGIGSPQRAALERLALRPSGLVAVGGRTGSGKTTLAYSLLLHIRDRTQGSANIMTVEDPVEYQLGGVAQVAVNRPPELTFPGALRSVLRSDPDIVYSGDIADRETAEVCVELALTGHLTIAAMNVSSAIGAIERLRDIGVERFLLAATLAGATGQALARRICPGCIETYTPPLEKLQWLGLSLVEDGPFRRGKGCDACQGRGYRGRVGLFEVLEMDDELRRLIAENASAETLWQASFGRNGGSLWDEAREKVRQGLTTVEEAMRVLLDYPHRPNAHPEREPFVLPALLEER